MSDPSLDPTGTGTGTGTGIGTGTASEPHSFGERLLGAVSLDASMYDEIEHDPSALPQAAGVVALAAVASGIGGLSGLAVGGLAGLVGGLVGAIVGWLLSTGVVWLIGVKWMKHTSDYPELLRTVGFASAPQMLMVIGIIGFLAPLAALVASIWQLVAYVVAVRQALDVTTGRAVLVCFLAVLTSFAAIALLGLLAAGCA